MEGNNFRVILDYKRISPNSPKKFTVSGIPTQTINFILIENDIYLLLERLPELSLVFLSNTDYTVKLFSRNLFDVYTRDLKVDELTRFISKNFLREFESSNGLLVFVFSRKLTQNPTIAPMQRPLSRPSSVSTQQTTAQPTLILPQQRSSQSLSTWPRQTLSRPSSAYSQQRSVQPLSASSQQRQNAKLKFEEIQRSSDNNFAHGKFRLTVSELRNLVQERAPLFTFDNMQLGFTVSKNSRNNANESLRVILYHKDINGGSLSMESKLISYISRSPIVKKVNRSNIQNKNTCSDMISWNLLFTSPNVFVQSDSCVIEVEIKIGKNRTPTAQADRRNNSSRMERPAVRPGGQSSSSRMECPICMDEMANKSKSSTSCGHIYCTACIIRSLSTSSTCPLCKKTISEGSLRPIFIP